MKKKFFYVLLLLMATNFPIKKGPDYTQIVEDYSIEEINYFYESYFNSNLSGVLKRWTKDIYYQFEGAMQADDSIVLHNVADWFNSQGFSIRMQPATSPEDANLRIVFRRTLVNKEVSRIGVAQVHGHEQIDSVEVEVLDTLQGELRKSVLEHELLHALGFCHVNTNYKSLVFPTYNSTRFAGSYKEQVALRMLYSHEWPEHCDDSLFEKTFADQLYHINSVKKFYTYFKSTSISKQILDTIYRYGIMQPDTLQAPQLYKHASRLEVIVKGEIPQIALDSLHLIVQEINRAAPSLQIEFATDTLAISGIYLNFIKDNTMPNDGVFVVGLTNAITKGDRINVVSDSRMNIYYNEAYKYFGRSLGNLLYSILVMKEKSSHYVPRKMFESDSTGFHLKPFYRQLLEVYYSPHLPHNFTKSQLEEVMQLVAADSISTTKH